MTAQIFTFYAVLTVMTFVLIWGLRIISRALEATNSSGRPLIKSMLTEPDPAPDLNLVKGSFSRTAGAFGAMGLSIATIGMAYWLIYALFLSVNDLKNIKDAWPFFLSGSALFAPYAFNQLSKIFKS